MKVVASDPLELVRRLKPEDSSLDIYLAGAGRLAGQVLPEIDRMVVKQYPVVDRLRSPGPAPDPMWAATRGACGPMTTACGLRSGAV